MTKKRNWQSVGEALPKEWGVTEFWMEGQHIVLTSRGIWMVLESPEEYK